MESKNNQRFEGRAAEVGDRVRSLSLAINVGVLAFALANLTMSFI